MKKSILAVAILGAFAGVASAQSSVTLQGTIDVNARYVKNAGSDRRVSMGNNGINAGQLVFSGTEDLGGGLVASFQLNSGISADTGNSSAEDGSGKFFNRRATVSLAGGFGEIRLGRDYTPTYWNNALFDAFGNLGVANSLNVKQIGSSGTFVRADNAISYFLPSKLGGAYGQIMVAASEGATAYPAAPKATCTVTGGTPGETCAVTVAGSGTTNGGRYIGGRLGFAAGPFDISVAAAEQRVDVTGGKYKTYNVGGSYDFGVVKVLGYVNRDTIDLPVSQRDTRGGVSVVVPMGQGEIHAGYSRGKSNANATSTDNTVNQYGLGYVYSLSKRTAVYSTVSRLSNGGLSSNSVAGGTSIVAAPTAGGSSTGFEFGVRHFF